MINRLAPIIAQKVKEVDLLSRFVRENLNHDIAKLYHGEKKVLTKSLKRALSGKLLSIIAEIKRKSPAKGALAMIEDPIKLARLYVEGGASALSILTDEKFFSGSTKDLQNVAQSDFVHETPLLRKDFIVDTLQIAEAAYLGADAVLCIVAILGEKTGEYLQFARDVGLEALVEVHDEKELEIAIAAGSEIIGVNNRNLSTFEIDPEQAIKLFPLMPDSCIKVAESGILAPALARRYHEVGFDAVLIGEALVTSKDPGKFIQECQYA